MADAGDRPSDAGDTGPGGDRGEADGGASDRTTVAHLAGRDRDAGPQNRRGGGSPSRLLHFPIAAGSWGSVGDALAGRIGVATRSLCQCRGGAEVQRNCTSDGAQWKEEMGALSLGLSQGFCGKVFTNGQDTRLRSRFGRVPITSSSASVVRTTMP